MIILSSLENYQRYDDDDDDDNDYAYDYDYDCDCDYDNDNYDDDDDNGKLCPTPFAQFYFFISKENKDRTKKMKENCALLLM